ncbi:MAG: tetratricopeptide repeat protein [bacterium]|nr:tetratricopeptide repeat protein [bacterium]
MKRRISDLTIRRSTLLLAISLLVLAMSGCVYYNTFYNARKAFNIAENARKEGLKRGHPSINAGQYNIAIEKSLKVIENHPNSKWYDDALYVLGVSYFQTGQYLKSERRMRELLANYPESQFIKEVNLYLAKAKLQQNEMAEAMTLFEVLLSDEYDRSIRAEAGMAIGEYHYENRDYDLAEPYFLFVRDSVGTNEEVEKAQEFVADAYFNSFQFDKALGAYLQVLGLEPEKDLKYHALYSAAICSYRLQRIADGMDYLKQLSDDELYFDSLAVLKLATAYGYELDEDIEGAISIYEEVSLDEANSRAAGEANLNLGLIYQYEYDDLKKAKEYYDLSTRLSRSSDIGRLALQKSSDIGKIETYARSLTIDSATTQTQIDEAAHTQYLLSELYWFQLNKPDSAMLEMQYLIDSFPTAYEVPKAMLALSRMYTEGTNDSTAADSIIDLIISNYSNSDYVGELMEMRNLIGTEADTGYAQVYIRQAEEFIDEGQIDSARARYQYVVDNFEDSKFFLQAKFATIWLTEQYQSPGDSSLIFAYNEFVDSFPNTFWSEEARKRTSYTPQRSFRDELADQEVIDSTSQEIAPVDGTADTSDYVDPYAAIYIGPDGDSITLLYPEVKPTVFREEFEFPLEAYRVQWIQMDFYFQIKLDFSGRVEDLRLMTPSSIEELDNRLLRYVQGMIFDIAPMPIEDQGQWKVYKHQVQKPRELR